MQILIGFGIAFCGMVVGFILHSFIQAGCAEDMAREWVRCCIKGLDSGEITIESLKDMLEEK